MPRVPLLLEERELIAAALAGDRDVSWSKLALELGRQRTTISREVTLRSGALSHVVRARRPRNWPLALYVNESPQNSDKAARRMRSVPTS